MDHVNDCMTVRNQLIALGETVPDKQFVDKLLNVDRELSCFRPMLSHAPIDEIVTGLTDGYIYHYQDHQHQHQHSKATLPCWCWQGPAGAASSADTCEGKAHLLLLQDLRLWLRKMLWQEERSEGATTTTD